MTTTTRFRYVIQEHAHQAKPVVEPILEKIVGVTTIAMMVFGVTMTMTATVIIHTVIWRMVTFAIIVRQMNIVMLPLTIMAIDCPFATSKRDFVIFVQ